MGLAMADTEDDLIDDDILEIFVEEAQEVLEVINEQFPHWRAEPDNAEIRLDIRRAFHTLKGSGRMVKATFISELAWSVENMMNRITDGTIVITDAMFDLIEQVRGVLPALIDAFQSRAGAPVAVEPMMEIADALSRGESPAAAAAPNVQAEAAEVPVPAAESAVMGEQALSEEDMQQINERLDTLNGQLAVFQKGLGDMQQGMQAMQADLQALQQRPQVSVVDVERLSSDVTAAQNGISALQGNLKAALTRIDADADGLRQSMSQLQSGNDDITALRTALDAEFKALRLEQAEAGRSTNTMVTVAVGVGLLCVGLVLFFHML